MHARAHARIMFYNKKLSGSEASKPRSDLSIKPEQNRNRKMLVFYRLALAVPGETEMIFCSGLIDRTILDKYICPNMPPVSLLYDSDDNTPVRYTYEQLKSALEINDSDEAVTHFRALYGTTRVSAGDIDFIKKLCDPRSYDNDSDSGNDYGDGDYDDCDSENDSGDGDGDGSGSDTENDGDGDGDGNECEDSRVCTCCVVVAVPMLPPDASNPKWHMPDVEVIDSDPALANDAAAATTTPRPQTPVNRTSPVQTRRHGVRSNTRPTQTSAQAS